MSFDEDAFPLRFGTLVSDEGRDIYAFELVVKNRPGILYVIGKEFKERNVNVLHLIHSDTEKDIVKLFVVGDFSEATSRPEDLLKEFESNKDLFIKVSLAKKVLSFTFSTSLFPIMINENRVILQCPAHNGGGGGKVALADVVTPDEHDVRFFLRQRGTRQEHERRNHPCQPRPRHRSNHHVLPSNRRMKAPTEMPGDLITAW